MREFFYCAMVERLVFMTLLYGALIGVINGFFASGGGIAAVLILEKFLKLETKKAHATAIAVILPLSLASLAVYGFKGYIDWPLVLKASVGGTLGAAVGAKLLERLPKKYIKICFGAVMVIAGFKMMLH